MLGKIYLFLFRQRRFYSFVKIRRNRGSAFAFDVLWHARSVPRSWIRNQLSEA